MAQGNHKLGKAKKSGGSQKRKTVKNTKKTKKGNTKVERNKGIIAATKAINRKNERIIAAKAMNAGTSFSLTDISEKGKMRSSTDIELLRRYLLVFLTAALPTGKNESKRQVADRDKKQNKPTKLTQRLQVRLNKLRK